MNIVMITTLGRLERLWQSLRSLRENAVDPGHTVTVVVDGTMASHADKASALAAYKTSVIFHDEKRGASASRNIGAGSIPVYRRQKVVMFLDDDVFMPGWDERMGRVLTMDDRMVASGHAHPYNHALGPLRDPAGSVIGCMAGVLSTVNFTMPWSAWDDVGPFIEPGGAGGSEDVDWCARATRKGYRLAVTEPMCVIHTGITSSNGKQIVGYDLMIKLNGRLVREAGLRGQVDFG
jgi:GT2 family glycosyltransferase